MSGQAAATGILRPASAVYSQDARGGRRTALGRRLKSVRSGAVSALWNLAYDGGMGVGAAEWPRRSRESLVRIGGHADRGVLFAGAAVVAAQRDKRVQGGGRRVLRVGRHVIEIHDELGDDRVDPQRATAKLAELGHRVVLCEGGPTLLGELVAAGCLDELCLTISPLVGGDPLPVSVAPHGAPLRYFALRHVMADSDTLFLRYERGRDHS